MPQWPWLLLADDLLVPVLSIQENMFFVHWSSRHVSLDPTERSRSTVGDLVDRLAFIWTSCPRSKCHFVKSKKVKSLGRLWRQVCVFSIKTKSLVIKTQKSCFNTNKKIQSKKLNYKKNNQKCLNAKKYLKLIWWKMFILIIIWLKFLFDWRHLFSVFGSYYG